MGNVRYTLADGINEKGLYVTALYHPGFAEYAPYDPTQASISMGPKDWVQYVLSQFATVEEVRKGLEKVRVVAIPEPLLGNIAPPLYFAVTDQTGKSIVVEYLKGELKIFDNPLRVMTNAPSFDWHMTNLRNYIHLSTTPFPDKKIARGLFVLSFTRKWPARNRMDRKLYTKSFASWTVFNLPLGSAEGSNQDERLKGMRSSTIWTSAANTKNLVYYFHTQHNRKVRMVNLKGIDFSSKGGVIVRIPLDKQKTQDIEDVTPR